VDTGQNFSLKIGEIVHQKFATLSSYNPLPTGNILSNTAFVEEIPYRINGSQHTIIVNIDTNPN